MTPITGYKSPGIDLWIAKLSQTVKAASVKAPAQLACKVLTLYSTSTLVFIGMVLNVWDDLWSAACTNPFRDLFYSMFQFFNVLTFLFHLFFFFLILLPMDFFCRNEVSLCRYRSRTSMVCHCVAHQKLIKLSCAMHVTCYFSPPQFFLQCFPTFPCWIKLPANRFSLLPQSSVPLSLL